MKRKAQIQLSESIFIVFFILIIIIFGIVFYAQAEGEGIVEKREQYLELDTVALAQVASSLAELQCSILEVSELSCLDILRVKAFANDLMVQDNDLVIEYYFSQLGDAEVVIEEIYPNNETYVVYNNTIDENLSYSGRPVMMPISLYDPTSNTYGFGVLYITKFSRVIS
jgi:hypothetical protein